jgi:tetratricopeptide (TPR) repeat protein
MSNVPDLDDEEEILAGSVRRLKDSLECDELAATIHHYPSLALLNQTVFTLDRPKSRLAQEYRRLEKVIRRNNLEDREGSLEFLKQLGGGQVRRRRPISLSDMDQRLSEIKAKHATDGEILRQIARLRKLQRRYAEAVSLLDEASKAGLVDSDLLLSRAEMNYSLDNKADAISDLRKLFTLSEMPIWELVGAVKLLADLDSREAEAVTTSPAVVALAAEDQTSLALELMSSSETRSVGEGLVGLLMSRNTAELKLSDTARNQLALPLIAQKRFSDAERLLMPQGTSQQALSLEQAFNYAMAVWGETGNPTRDLFQQVLDRQRERAHADANFLQCLALAYWVAGDKDQALEQLAGSRRLLATRGGETFSVWRYLIVPPALFSQDLDAMERMINGDKIKPLVLQDPTIQ